MDPLIEIGEPHRAASEKDIYSRKKQNKQEERTAYPRSALGGGSPITPGLLIQLPKSTTATSSPQIELICWMLMWSPSKIEDRHRHKGLNPLGE